MITLDGSEGEGGGALIRVALALSTLTGQSFEVDNIRAGRPNGGGLKAQHLAAIKALKEICDAKVNEVELGSSKLRYIPNKIKGGKYNIDIGTAGSITLLLQALILPCMFASSKVTLQVRGGTCGKWQASVDYLQNILLPHLRRFVDKIELQVLKRGYYPKGGGMIKLEISPKFNLNKFDSFATFLEELQLSVPKMVLLEQGELEQIKGIVNLSTELEDRDVGERIKQAAKVHLNKFLQPTNIRVDYATSPSIGGEVLLWGVFSKDTKIDFTNPTLLSGDALIEKSKSSEDIGVEAAAELKEEIKSLGVVDKWLCDQLIQFMGLLPDSEILTSTVTSHTKTNVDIVEKFLPVGFKIEENKIKCLTHQ
jgi:RNA 3'-phosphate cyclase